LTLPFDCVTAGSHQFCSVGQTGDCLPLHSVGRAGVPPGLRGGMMKARKNRQRHEKITISDFHGIQQ
jgi:hypothetical protein